MSDRSPEAVPIPEAAFKPGLGVYPHSERVLVPGRERSRLSPAQPGVEYSRDLVHGLDLDANSSACVRDRAHVRRREERLRAQESLRLRPPELCAWPPDFERHEPADDAVAGRRVVEADASRDLSPHAHVAAERGPLRPNENCPNRVAVARDGRRDRVSRDRGLQSGLGRSS